MRLQNLGYASTAHRSQGVTVDRAITAVDPAATSRETFYVGMTRGRHSNTAVLSQPEPADDGPDPWQMIKEITPATARDQLTRVLDRSETELTAHEVRDHAHGWDADLPHLTDELRYVGQAIATRQAVDWVRQTHGPDAVTRWANTEHWNAIINELTRGHQLPDSPVETPREALAAIKDTPQQHREAGHGGLTVPRAETPAEIQTVEQVFDKISARLATLRTQTRDEPWRADIEPLTPERVDAALIARQLCHWHDEYKVLPDQTPSDPRAAEAWHAFRTTATATADTEQTSSPQGPPTPAPDALRPEDYGTAVRIGDI